MQLLIYLLAGLAGLLLAGPAMAQGDSIAPDQPMQEKIVTMTGKARSDPIEFYRDAYDMHAHVGNHAGLVHWIEQLAYFAKQGSNDLPVARVVVFRRATYLTGLRPATLVDALGQYVDSPDEELRRFVIQEVLGGLDRPEASDVDIGPLVYYALKRQSDLSPRFADIMYRQNPRKAFMNLISVYHSDRERSSKLAWSDHLIADVRWKLACDMLDSDDIPKAQAELKFLATAEEWWVRRYAAEIVWREPELADPLILGRLRNDKDELVRRAVDRPKPLQEPGR
jgi:hypothetical protein